MSTAKDYMEFQEDTFSILNALEKISKISYITFINDSSDDLENSELEYAIKIKEVLEDSLMEFFIKTNLENTPIPQFYDGLTDVSVTKQEGSFFQYYGGDLEHFLEVLDNGNCETLASTLKNDYIYGLYSDFTIIKTAILAWRRIKRAIQFSLQRQGDLVLITRLNNLRDYVVEESRTTGFDVIFFEWQPNVTQFSLNLEFEEGVYGDLKVAPSFVHAEGENQQKREQVAQVIDNMKKSIQSKVWELGLNREDLELVYTIGPIERE